MICGKYTLVCLPVTRYDLTDNADSAAEPCFTVRQPTLLPGKNIYRAVFEMPCGSIAYAVITAVCECHFTAGRCNDISGFHVFVEHQTVTACHIPEKVTPYRFRRTAVPGLFPETELSVDFFVNLACDIGIEA